MDFYKLFYWITVADRMQTFIMAIAVISAVFLALNIITGLVAKFSQALYNTEGTTDWKKNGVILQWTRRLYRIIIPIFLAFWFLFVAIPSKADTILIIAGGGIGNFMQHDSAAKQIPPAMTNFVVTKINELTNEARQSQGLLNPKEKALKSMEDMTKEQIIEALKKDTTISKLAQ